MRARLHAVRYKKMSVRSEEVHRTITLMTLVIALTLSVRGTAIAGGKGNAPDHAGTNEDSGVIKDYQSRLGVLDYLGNNSGFHLWFTVEEGTLLANNSNYEIGDSYHNIYKWADQIGEVDPTEWYGPINIPNREPYNLQGGFGDGQTSREAYYKIWNVTTETWVLGSDGS